HTSATISTYTSYSSVALSQQIVPTLAMLFFLFHDPATTEIYTLSLHDALPICATSASQACWSSVRCRSTFCLQCGQSVRTRRWRSEEHTSELQSPYDLVCRLLLEKKKQKKNKTIANSQNKLQNHNDTQPLYANT